MKFFIVTLFLTITVSAQANVQSSLVEFLVDDKVADCVQELKRGVKNLDFATTLDLTAGNVKQSSTDENGKNITRTTEINYILVLKGSSAVGVATLTVIEKFQSKGFAENIPYVESCSVSM